MNKIKVNKIEVHYNKPKDGYFAEINYMHGDADFYDSEVIHFADKDEMIEHYFASSFKYDRHDWVGVSFDSIVITLEKFGFKTITEVSEKFSFFDECESVSDDLRNKNIADIEDDKHKKQVKRLFNDFIRREDFELVKSDKTCDGWHAADVQGIEYYQMKNGKKYEIEFEIKGEE